MLVFILILVTIIILFILFVRQEKILITSNHNTSVELDKIIDNRFVVQDVGHYKCYTVIKNKKAIALTLKPKGKYITNTDVYCNVFLIYNKAKFPNGFNLTKSALTDWLNKTTTEYNISYGAVRGISKRAIANYTGLEYEDLVKNIGESDIYDFYESFQEWFEGAKLDFSFTCTINGLSDSMGIATVDGLDHKNINYPLHSTNYTLSTNNENYIKHFSYLKSVLSELTVLHPNTYIKKIDV